MIEYVIFSSSAAISEVDISNQEPFSSEVHAIYATFSLSPGQALQWYFKGYPLEKLTSNVLVGSDGLNAVLFVRTSTEDVYGKYTLLIAGTSIRDTIAFLSGMLFSYSVWIMHELHTQCHMNRKIAFPKTVIFMQTH